ncbi:hypothetical protein SAMN04488564_102396 [Lentzea waywayandensis]|uniref:Uncharacterized protein n=1 Tax=Lentzea waywayandensis TaxID=84724 RepID=A0A1I6DEH2_9PSEU|nr:hypothetical protein SAMN04488564_102396 [Lentzea waywayandensis]
MLPSRDAGSRIPHCANGLWALGNPGAAAASSIPHSVTKVWGSGYPPNRKIDVWITRASSAHYGEFYTDAAGNWYIASNGWLTESVTVHIFDSVTTKTPRVVSSTCGGGGTAVQPE